MPSFSLPLRRLAVIAALAAAAVMAAALLPGCSGPGRPAIPRPATAGAPVHARLTAAAAPAAPSLGPCSIPGISAIGGLGALCDLGSGVLGALNNACDPSLPDPEPASGGIDALVTPPSDGPPPAHGTLYDEYGVAGNTWAATNLQCSDLSSLTGNQLAGTVFDGAKSIDRVTITVYQAAAGNGVVSWLQHVTNALISGIGRTVFFPYLPVAVIIGALWLAWQGLIRKRGTLTIQGIVWMIAAAASAIVLIDAPAAVTGTGAAVTDTIGHVLNLAFAGLPSPGPSDCVPVQSGDPQARPVSYAYTAGTVVDQNADELWSVLVCKPWLVGEFGSDAYTASGGRPTAVNTYGRSLLWAQAIASDEKATPALIKAKQSAYAGIAASMQQKDPANYPLFQGKEWQTRLEIALAALFAAGVAGVLLLLVSVSLILLKLGFLLLLIIGPLFLLIGIHPGGGRVVALRWAEMLVGVLIKQTAIALMLSVLMYCYALIAGTPDKQLPWVLKILMFALVTVAAFLYRKPFQHLFTAGGHHLTGSPERAAAALALARETARSGTSLLVTKKPAAGAGQGVGAQKRRGGALRKIAAGMIRGGGTDPSTRQRNWDAPDAAKDHASIRKGRRILRRRGGGPPGESGSTGQAPATGKSAQGGQTVAADTAEPQPPSRTRAGDAGGEGGTSAGRKLRNRLRRDPATAAGQPKEAAPPRNPGTSRQPVPGWLTPGRLALAARLARAGLRGARRMK